ncbi:hypothetical protein HYPSUDRAFT_662552 [Hypholoma sublateritium FD-334 SS-4]|uniref:Uncharacterized protein n=1 Tax=Hypholoma sublateritium (strain FD-334 SS-4) TaxID=945553 RepID=A0A0D2PR24_HYPSF|nr:hypothetical protein HYPSUDRAFT_662552 [Hypholoma sublateritium FD-334 SS-4]
MRVIRCASSDSVVRSCAYAVRYRPLFTCRLSFPSRGPTTSRCLPPPTRSCAMRHGVALLSLNKNRVSVVCLSADIAVIFSSAFLLHLAAVPRISCMIAHLPPGSDWRCATAVIGNKRTGSNS